MSSLVDALFGVVARLNYNALPDPKRFSRDALLRSIADALSAGPRSNS